MNKGKTHCGSRNGEALVMIGSDHLWTVRDCVTAGEEGRKKSVHDGGRRKRIKTARGGVQGRIIKCIHTL